MREHLIWDGNTFAPAHEVYARRGMEAARTRSALPMPAYISDDLGPNGLECHADGKTYTSKAAYLKAVRDNGCYVVGNDKLPKPQKKKVKLSDDIRREIRQKVQALDSPTRPKRPPRDYFGGSKRGLK